MFCLELDAKFYHDISNGDIPAFFRYLTVDTQSGYLFVGAMYVTSSLCLFIFYIIILFYFKSIREEQIHVKLMNNAKKITMNNNVNNVYM